MSCAGRRSGKLKENVELSQREMRQAEARREERRSNEASGYSKYFQTFLGLYDVLDL